MTDTFTKKERKMLRELASLAHERELEDALNKLDKEFSEWKSGNIDAFELSHRIHLFHNGPSQKLYKKYNYSDTDYLSVAWAIARGIIKRDEVDKNLLENLEFIIEQYS